MQKKAGEGPIRGENTTVCEHKGNGPVPPTEEKGLLLWGNRKRKGVGG